MILLLPKNCSELTKILLPLASDYVIKNPDSPIYKAATSHEQKQLRLLELPPASVSERLGLSEYYDHDDKKKEKNLRDKLGRNKGTAAKHLRNALGLPPSTPKKKASTVRRGDPSTTGRNVPAVAADTLEPPVKPTATGGGEDDLNGLKRILFSAMGQIAQGTLSNQRDIGALADALTTMSAAVRQFVESQMAWNKRLGDFIEKQLAWNTLQEEKHEAQQGWNKRLETEHDARLSKLDRAVGLTPPRPKRT